MYSDYTNFVTGKTPPSIIQESVETSQKEEKTPLLKENDPAQQPPEPQQSSQLTIDFSRRFSYLHPRWYQSTLFRRRSGKALLGLGALLGGGALYSAFFLTGPASIIIGLTWGLGGGSVGSTITGIVMRALPESWECPENRRNKAKAALKDIQENKKNYRQIRETYGDLIDRYQLLSHEDLNALLDNDVKCLDYPKFKELHGVEALKILDPNKKEVMGEKLILYLINLRQDRATLLNTWNNELSILGINPIVLESQAVQRAFNLLENGEDTYPTFLASCGKDAFKFLNEEQLKFVQENFLEHLQNQKSGLLEISKDYPYEWEQFQLSNMKLDPYVLPNQLQMLKDELLDFKSFYRKNGLDWESIYPLPPQLKQKYLELDYVNLISPHYESARQKLNVSPEDIFQRIEEDACLFSYSYFLNKHTVKAMELYDPKKGSIRNCIQKRVLADLPTLHTFDQIVNTFPMELIEMGFIPHEQVKQRLIKSLKQNATDLFENKSIDVSIYYSKLMTNDVEKLYAVYSAKSEKIRNEHLQQIQKIESIKEKELKFEEEKCERELRECETEKRRLQNEIKSAAVPAEVFCK